MDTTLRKVTIYIGAVGLVIAALASYDYLTAPAEFTFEHAPIAQHDRSGVTPTTIRVPDLGIEVALEPGSIINDTWVLSDEAANYLDVSGKLGEIGNAVVYGHDKKSIFGNFNDAKIGQTIYLMGNDGVERAYTINQVFETTPENVDVIQPTTHEQLTIYTCTGWRNSKRLIVQAQPLL